MREFHASIGRTSSSDRSTIDRDRATTSSFAATRVLCRADDIVSQVVVLGSCSLRDWGVSTRMTGRERAVLDALLSVEFDGAVERCSRGLLRLRSRRLVVVRRLPGVLGRRCRREQCWRRRGRGRVPLPAWRS
jgi:hypothetical protein